MTTSFSEFQIHQFKRRAKRIAREQSISYSAALDLVAQQNGFPNWSLLMRRVEHDIRLLSLLEFSLDPFPDGDEGVFQARGEIIDRGLLTRIADERPTFEIATRAGWIVRAATEPAFKLAPYLSMTYGPMRGIFIDGTWTAIVSVNGGTRAEMRRRIAADLPIISAELHARAATALEPWLSDNPQPFRLFWSQPQPSGVAAVKEKAVATLEAAMNAELPGGATPIGIASAKGWHTFQRPFGWQSPAKPEVIYPNEAVRIGGDKMPDRLPSAEEIREAIIDYAKPLNLEALVESGVLKKVGAWYQILDMKRLPKHVSDHIKAMKSGKNGVGLVQFAPVTQRAIKLAAKVTSKR